MANSALKHREQLLEQGRQMSERYANPGKYTNFPEGRESYGEQAPAKWKLRTFFAVLLFVGFVYLDSTGADIFKVDSKSVETAISENIDTESVMKVVDKAKEMF